MKKSVPTSTLRSRFCPITESLVLPGVNVAHIPKTISVCNQIKMLKLVRKKDMNISFASHYKSRKNWPLCFGNVHRIRSRHVTASDKPARSVGDIDVCVELCD